MNLFKNPEEKLRDMADDFFRNFQKNNRPSQLAYIQANSDEGFFDAVKDMVLQGSDTKQVTIMRLEHEVVNIEEEGTRYVGSIRYQSVVREDGVDTELDEVWHFIYKGGKWLLAGIEQVAQ